MRRTAPLALGPLPFPCQPARSRPAGSRRWVSAGTSPASGPAATTPRSAGSTSARSLSRGFSCTSAAGAPAAAGPLLSRVVPPRLGAAAALRHAAPPPAPVLRRVEEEPAALRVGAHPETLELRRRDEERDVPGDPVEDRLRPGLPRMRPAEPRAASLEAKPRGAQPQRLVEGAQRDFARQVPPRERRQDLVRDRPELAPLRQARRRPPRLRCLPSPDRRGLLRAEEPAVAGPRDQGREGADPVVHEAARFPGDGVVEGDGERGGGDPHLRISAPGVVRGTRARWPYRSTCVDR